jgi:sigma-E factor negative regulatory protein RseA
MKHTPELVREQISALADGRLQGEEFAQVVGRLGADDESRATWHAYHLVGDVLRAGRYSACSDSTAFLARFQERLVAEPGLSSVLRSVQAVPQRPAEAANEPVFRWKLVAGAASLAAAAAIGWNWVGGVGAPPPGAQMAQRQQQQEPQQPRAQEGSVLAAIQQQAGPSSDGRAEAARVLVGSGSGSGSGVAQVMLRDPRLDRLLEAHRQTAGGAQMPSGFLRNATFEGSAR